MITRYKYSSIFVLAGCLLILEACTPVTLTPEGTKEPGAPVAYETAYPPPVTNTPPAYPPPGFVPATATPDRPPQCQFPGGPTPEASGPGLDSYVLSEPSVVLTSTTGLEIAAWLPDNERLLLTNYPPNNGNQIIETFNTLTGEIQVYAERYQGGEMPIWLPSLDAVAYTTVIYDDSLPRGGRQELRVSYGNPQTFEVIAQDVFNLSLVTDGTRLLYFDRAIGDQPQAWSFSTRSPEAVALDLTNRAYAKVPAYPPQSGTTFGIAPQPGGQWMAFYGSGLLYLADTQTSLLCEIDLGERYPFDIQWSTDGRYLAFINGVINPGLSYFLSSEVVVLDITTGAQVRPTLESSFIHEINWGPDSRTLAALARMDVVNGRPYKGLFLLDVVNGSYRSLLPNQIFGGGTGSQFAWSPSGQSIAIKCPVWSESKPLIIEDRICVIDVQMP